jgi:hypothetical protein
MNETSARIVDVFAANLHGLTFCERNGSGEIDVVFNANRETATRGAA